MGSEVVWHRTPRRKTGIASRLQLCIGAVLAGGLFGTPAESPAQQSPNGPQLQVNTYTPSNQRYPQVGHDSQGNFLVVWQSYGSFGTDSSSRSIQAQRYSAGGERLGGEIQLNSFTTGSQSEPELAVNGDGSFVAVWESAASSGSDSSGYSIQMRRFDAAGLPLGVEFQVNDYTTGNQSHPAVAMDGQGRYIVAWTSVGSAGEDTDGRSVQAQRFDATGVPLGGQFQVNTYSILDQRYQDVAADDEGNFVVVWQSAGSSGSDDSGTSIQGQRYDSTGVPSGGEFQANSYTTGHQFGVQVASDEGDSFMIAWASGYSGGTDSSGHSVQARRLAADGVPLDDDVQVNTYTTGLQFQATVASEGEGRFVVAWTSTRSSGSDTDLSSIQAQRFGAEGNASGGQFEVNSYSTGRQYMPFVASDERGNFVVTWMSAGSNGTDSIGYSIQAQRFDGLFRDAFETSNTGRWSSTVP